MNPRELEIETIEDGDDRKVAALLGSLKRVEAPSNFEFSLRARIAAGAPSEPSSIFRFLKIAAPLTLVLLVGAFVLFFGSMPKADVPPVAESKPSVAQPQLSEIDVPSQVVTTEPGDEQVSGPNALETQPQRRSEERQSGSLDVQVAARNANKANRNRRPSSIDMPTRGGSLDQTKNITPVISPTGMGNDVPVKDVLEMLGMKADFVKNGWKIRTAAQGSISDKSGFKPGDVIESVDGLAVSDKTSFKGGFSGKTFGIRRDGKPIEIKLAN